MTTLSDALTKSVETLHCVTGITCDPPDGTQEEDAQRLHDAARAVTKLLAPFVDTTDDDAEPIEVPSGLDLGEGANL